MHVYSSASSARHSVVGRIFTFISLHFSSCLLLYRYVPLTHHPFPLASPNEYQLALVTRRRAVYKMSAISQGTGWFAEHTQHAHQGVRSTSYWPFQPWVVLCITQVRLASDTQSHWIFKLQVLSVTYKSWNCAHHRAMNAPVLGLRFHAYCGAWTFGDIQRSIMRCCCAWCIFAKWKLAVASTLSAKIVPYLCSTALPPP